MHKLLLQLNDQVAGDVAVNLVTKVEIISINGDLFIMIVLFCLNKISELSFQELPCCASGLTDGFKRETNDVQNIWTDNIMQRCQLAPLQIWPIVIAVFVAKIYVLPKKQYFPWSPGSWRAGRLMLLVNQAVCLGRQRQLRWFWFSWQLFPRS